MTEAPPPRDESKRLSTPRPKMWGLLFSGNTGPADPGTLMR